MQGLISLLRACKYSYEPNKLGYCGPEGANEKFLSFIENPSGEKAVVAKKLLMDFPALYPYLSLIAEKNNLHAFDEEVIEAYWLGNRLLEKVERKDVEDLILTKFSGNSSGKNASGEGMLPKNLVAEKAKGLPQKPLISHSFHVLYMNFITRKVEPIIKNLDSCLVKGAKVEAVKENSLSVKTYSLFHESGSFKLRERKMKLGKGFCGNAEKGDFISTHWNFPVEIIGKEESDSIMLYLGKNLK